MKRKEKKELEKFVNEKLDYLHDTSGLKYTPPADAAQRQERVVAYFENTIKRRDSSRKIEIARPKKKVFVGLAASATSLILIGVFIIIAIANKVDAQFYYNDDDLIHVAYTLTDFQDNFDVLLPDMTNASNTVVVYRHIKKGTDVYAKVILVNELNERTELNIVFVDNYKFQSELYYSNLSKSGQTVLFSYTYDNVEDIQVSYAKFVYDENIYYLKLNYNAPENITSLLNSFN